ncbi:MAG: magnesium/cobalt transporter CorA [Candidatus Cloacimonetes bacterium]|nr:magnesium/cobalt transporter CorA [Candidatus Cloacimonadota bacterium]
MNAQQVNPKTKLGLAPGSLVFTGTQKMTKVKLTLIQYSESEVHSFDPQSAREALDKMASYSGSSWLNVDGLQDIELVEQICSFLDVHKLTIEDILSVNQRPKLEEHNQYLYLVIRMLSSFPADLQVDFEQVSFLLKDKILITFQEKTGDTFEYVRKRIFENKGSIRRKNTDYLLYSLLDSIVDHYFLILESVGESLTDLETVLLEKPQKDSLKQIHHFRKEMINIRRSIFPLREVVSRLDKLEEPLLSPNLNLFIRDLYDHTLRVIETLESYRDTISGLLDLYMNSVSIRMNEIMKVLTIIATIFIPLTFIAGIYGMNFDYMPELHWKFGYFASLGLMLALLIFMLLFFRRKNWL